MRRIVVIADDITGAAEIAGIAHRKGLDVKFVLWPVHQIPLADVTVIATDTRSASAKEAESTSAAIADVLSHALETKGSDFVLFKKTDSVLRGHIVAELRALMSRLGYDKALLLPQNPSKGRCITAGRYFIDNVALDETPFNHDPEFPATTSYASVLLPGTTSLTLNRNISYGINIADASSPEEINLQLEKVDPQAILSGGADLFTQYLSRRNIAHVQDNARVALRSTPNEAIIAVCGSTQSVHLEDKPFFKEHNAKEIAMSHGVFHGSAPVEQWIDALTKAYTDRGSVIMTIGHPATGGKSYATRLRDDFAQAVQSLVSTHTPTLLIIEGGATAFSILQRLHWTVLSVSVQLAPGIVSLSYSPNTEFKLTSPIAQIILKPGSYPWGSLWD